MVRAPKSCSRSLSKPQGLCCLLPHAAPCSRRPCVHAAAADTHAAAAWLGLPQQVWRERAVQRQLQQSLSELREHRVLRTQRRHFSSGMRNTKAGIRNPYWRRRGFWEWRRRAITALNRRMRKRKHLFPRKGYKYLPHGHPLSASAATSSSSGSSMQAFASSLFLGENEGEVGTDGSVVPLQEGRRRRGQNKAGGFLRDCDANAFYSEKMDYLAAPVKGEGRVWVVKKATLPMGRKRLLLLLRLIKGLQLTDATDWLQALAQHRCNSLLNVLFKEQEKIRDDGADPSRVYVEQYLIGPAGHVKTMRVCFLLFPPSVAGNLKRGTGLFTQMGCPCVVSYHYRVSFLKSYRYFVSLRLRELPLHELFHRTFILKKPPRSLSHDMRTAIKQKQLPPEVVRDWVPYLDAATRYQHKQRLRFLDKQRLFNYMLARRAFLYSYISRMRQMHEEAAAARGTTLHALQASLSSPKRQLKGIEYPQD
ncbi:hypothetical protein Esti_005628 [Eimeria stiedai]